ncbi:dethiobiotin synthase [Rickettsiella endosymbiont of Dermanyssus gallinae]|uniref:dethiobiotin synthase n=1 Tax=Rickettsiella endosymbiont of Dermanyssus gallinae TaxID=2856608 RepID=UPI001C5328BE|nr:dethiobiotin synthase [Rickettsiella endosymbiont of Dermanyssus gallinae]
MANKSFFILGTDTGVGKTMVASALLIGLKARGLSTIGLKPIASGAQLTPMGLRNDDALSLQKAASIFLPYHQVNPFCFADPIAPHIAAEREKKILSVSAITQSCQLALSYQADYGVIEGVGGVCVPLNKKETFTDLVQIMGAPIILVVGMRLGCLNQALLTWKYLQQRQLPVIGWIANQVDPMMEYIEENINFLKSSLAVPYLGFIPYLQEIDLSVFPALINYEPLLGVLETISI